MNFSKKIALLMLVTGCFFLVLNLGAFIYLHERVIIDFNYPPRQIPSSYANPYLIVSCILSTILFIGLYLVLRSFKEGRWIGISIMVCWIIKIIMLLSLTIISFYPDVIKTHIQEISFLLGNLPLWFMLFALLFVKNKKIKPYFLTYSIIGIVICFASAIGSKLYDDFSIHWALINPDAMLLVAHLPIVALFFKIYTLLKPKVTVHDSL
jgi:hypothetical protein